VTKPLRILSLGAGVQSSTLALLAATGEIEPVQHAVFADTQWEPRKVYEWLNWLEGEIGRSPYPFPVHRVTKGSLRDNILTSKNTTGGRVAAVPWHMVMPNGDRAMGRRQCTAEYKIGPLVKKQRELVGLKPRQRCKEIVCETLIGISTDEAYRMKPSQEGWKVHRWPLIDLRMNRQDCLNWMERKGYPLPPKSSCIGCPYHSDTEWRHIKADPESWADAVELDKVIREQPRFHAKQYMHRSCVPLDEVDFSTAEERGQADMFNNECEGMCGV
jgi:hypothetical protein